MRKMEQLGMVGATVRRRGQAWVSRLSVPEGEAGDDFLRALHAKCSFEESAVVATCNRVEMIFVAPPGVDCAEARRRLWHLWPAVAASSPAAGQAGAAAPHSAAHGLHAYAGEGAAERLFVVAAALDSLHPGDAQVLGQVKATLRRARRLGTAGPQLTGVFEEAFAVAKRVRHSTAIGQGQVSMLSLARAPIGRRLAAGGRPRLAVVGAGSMAQAAGAMFAGRDDVERLFVNRTGERAAALAARFGGRGVPLVDFLAAPGRQDVIVTATAAPTPLFDAAFLARLPAPLPLMVDLSVHHDVEPGAALAMGAELWDIDRLAHLSGGNLEARRGELAAARHLVDEALDAYRRRLLARAVAPRLQAMRRALLGSLERDLEGLPPPPLDAHGRLDQELWRQRLRVWGQRAAQRLAHGPTVGLRALADAHGLEAVDDFVGATCRRPGSAGAAGGPTCS